MKRELRAVLASLIFFVAACTCHKKAKYAEVKNTAGLAPAVVYKTTKDYFNNVPVQLSEDGSHIVSYPAPTDLVNNQRYTLPIKLAKEYLLDNRGIGKNTAFLDYTYEQFALFIEVPSEQELMKHVIDKKPLKELYNLGDRVNVSDPEKDINALIKDKALGKKYPNLMKQ